MIIHVYRKSVRVLSPTSYVIEPTGRFRNEMEKESGKAERSFNQLFPWTNNFERFWIIFLKDFSRSDKNPAFFPRFALKASPSSPSDSRPLSRGSKSREAIPYCLATTPSPSSSVANGGFAPLCGAATTLVVALKTPVAPEEGTTLGAPQATIFCSILF